MAKALQLLFATGPTIYFLILIGVGFISMIVMTLRLIAIYIYNAYRHGKAEAMTRMERELP